MIRTLVENGRLTALAIVLLIVAGLGALNQLPRTEDPRITNRHASVITHYPGASAERVEALISEPMESKLRTLPEMDEITSVSRPGISIVKLKLRDDIYHSTPIWSQVRDEIAEVAFSLPQGALAPRLDDDKGYAFTTLIGLTWQGEGETNLAIVQRYARELQDQLRNLHGTDYVELYGQPQEEILVEIDPHAAAAMQYSAAEVAQLIGAADAKISAGELVNKHNKLQVELTGALDSLERIRQIPLRSDQRGFIYHLGDLADISRQLQSPDAQRVLLAGERGIVVAARMLPNERVDLWSQDLRDKLAQFKQQLPGNIELTMLFEQQEYTDWRLGELLLNVLEGFVIISLVLFLTLGFRAAMIVATALPLTVMFTLTCMNYIGLPIHQMSVTGLVVALGIMVDNAIVMVDAIQQRRQKGMSALAAVKASVQHFWLPLLGSTLTTVLAFSPIVMMPGPAGEFVGGIAYSVILSLIGSYIISHTLVAGLAGRFIRAGEETHHWWQHGLAFHRTSQWFNRSLRWTLQRPVLTLLVMTILPFSGFYAASKLTEQFFPPSDRDMFQVELYLPAQASIDATTRVAESVSAAIAGEQDIKNLHWFIGENAPSFYYNMVPRQQGAQNYAQAMVTTTNMDAANRLIPALQRKLDDLFPQAQILVRKLEQGPPFNAPVELRIYGPNLDTLKTLGDQARRIMLETPQVIHARATLQPGTPKVWLNVDEDSSRLSGLTLTQIANQLQNGLTGAVRGSILETTESVPVRVRVSGEQRSNLHRLTELRLSSPEHPHPIALTSIATASLKPSRGAIPHRNGERVNIIEGYLRADILPSEVLNAFKQRLAEAELELPAGYRFEYGGESAKRNKAVGNLLANVGFLGILLVTVIVVSFNSFRMTTVILFSAIQAAGLGLLSVFLGGYPFGFTVIIALLGLMGLAINAAIVILAEFKADPQALAGDLDAIRHAVQSCSRHISSTTITTVGGFMPLLLAGGGFWPPFAVAIAGGTALTALLSFYFVPSAFVLLRRIKPFCKNSEAATANA
ncbi:AcrB/AcrD/AcrF family protein [Corallincola holothuriorum]|uniref:AcrB/AcrD/AcrF family protein n=1 Tax=Corallincola holothuriorum TaxID=2282215 RepID=A0A368NNG6_9GAMM|nr:efflux RND transporter permease subunit [Corallincola holothuriorum]RCU51706.1 AcrB/AcrD/AcrF family protein [Corallincola holothuriorum]